MNILLFTLEYPPFKGGVANYYEKIVTYWPTDSIFVLDNNDNKLVNNSVPVLKWLPCIYFLFKNIKKNKIDHVIVGNVLPLGTASLLMLKMLGVQYTVIIHGTDIIYAQKINRKNKLVKLILNSAKNIICNSDYVANIVKKKLTVKMHSKVTVVNPGIDNKKHNNLEYLKQGLTKKYALDNKRILFSVGRLIRRKGVDKVIQILPEIISKYPNVIYAVAGTGPDEDYLKTLAINFKNNIFFLGRISDEEKWSWMDMCDIFVQPAREEDGNFDGFGIVYLEANFMSKAVVAGNSGGVSDAVEDNINGLLVDPESNEKIKNAIIKLLDDNNLRIKLGEQGKERLKKFDSKDKVNDIYKIIYKK